MVPTFYGTNLTLISDVNQEKETLLKSILIICLCGEILKKHNKLVSMTRKCHIHRIPTNPRYRKEKSQDNIYIFEAIL